MVHRTRLTASHELPTAAREAFIRDGVIIIEGFATHDACDRLRERAAALVAEHAPAALANSPTVFSTTDQRHARDRYFEESADGIGVFFEERAFDAEGKLCVPLERAVNKLGHAMHDLDPVFRDFSSGERLNNVAQAIGLADAKLVQSMMIFKQPGIGGEVTVHQDATFLHTEPESVAGFWFALEDARRDNGCLGGLPGEHTRGLREIFQRDENGALKITTLQPDLKWNMAKLEWLEVAKGGLIVFDGMFPHLSEANRSPHSRHAYTLHAVSARATYPASNWLQRRNLQALPWRGFACERV
jgi:phytanoyl-CoA hydroxylase